MVSRFLLHDSSDMSIGGISGKRKLSIWGRGLDWHRCHLEALWLLKSLLSSGGPLLSLGPPPSGDQSKVLGLEHSWAKNGSKNFTVTRKCYSCLTS